MPRVVKTTRVSYKTEEQQPKATERQRSRQNDTKQKKQIQKNEPVKVDMSRRAKMLALRKQQQQQQFFNQTNQNNPSVNSVQIVIKDNQKQYAQSIKIQQQQPKEQKVSTQVHEKTQNHLKKVQQNNNKNLSSQQSENQEQIEKERARMKPVFMNKTNRDQITLQNNIDTEEAHLKQQERKKKALRYTTKAMLKEIDHQSEQENEANNDISDDQIYKITLPSDDDHENQRYEYELWKIRELKRIRRDKQQRQKDIMEKAELERRRKMNNEEILLENRMLGSDATDNNTQTKYVFMQKYYHKGAFYQDDKDEVLNRDYNLPTPLEMQDKSLLPAIMQRRKGQFGMKGQTKYTHLSAQDTTNFDPQYRPDQSIMNNWKKKTAGYKSQGRNI